MSIEAMKQMVEALEDINSLLTNMTGATFSKLEVALKAGRQAIAEAEKQEPVAWMHNHIKGNVIAHRPVTLDRHPEHWTALYPEPKPCPTCEALARTVMLDQISYDTSPKIEQEPVAWVSSVAEAGDKGVRVRWVGGFPQIGDRLYTSPPQRQPLTDEQIIKCWGQVGGTRHGYAPFARAIEAAHDIKGEA